MEAKIKMIVLSLLFLIGLLSFGAISRLKGLNPTNSSIKIEKKSKEYYEVSKHSYIINYYHDEINEDNLIATIEKKDDYGKNVIVDTNYKIPNGYIYLGENLNFTIGDNDNKINVVYSKKKNLTYCVNYFYGGIIDINKTECYYNEPYGKRITTFIDKPKDGYIFDSFEPITLLEQEENILNVYYKNKN